MNNRRQFLIASASFAAATAMGGVAPAFAGGKKGEFEGRSDHITTGKVKIYNGKVTLGSDFSLDGAPDPRVGFGNNGHFDGNTDLGALKNLTGEQSYEIPAGIDVSQYNEVYIWCRKFSVPLGVAKIN